MSIRFFTSKVLPPFSLIFLGGLALVTGGGCMNTKMPGKSWGSAEFIPDSDETLLADELRRDVVKISKDIGPRNLDHYDKLNETVAWIGEEFKTAGCGLSVQEYKARPNYFLELFRWKRSPALSFYNVIGEIKGSSRPEDIIVVGAHYDSARLEGCLAANDNGSGIAGMLAMARRFAKEPPACTIRFVAFPNEEPPFFWTSGMGSLVYAKSCRAKKEKIIAMFSLETIGYYSEEKGSQHYPPPLSCRYPDKGNFIAFVSNHRTAPLLKRSVEIFRETTQFPSEGAALPGLLPGVGWSDHWSFWRAGYQGVMVTDTAPFRYPYYHTKNDNPENLDYVKMARVVKGVGKVVRELSKNQSIE